MAEPGRCNWTGASGTKYTYFVYALPVNFNANQDGNYIYSRKNDKGQWLPVYIGQGDLADRISDNHHRADCIRKKGATHVQVHLNTKEKEPALPWTPMASRLWARS